MSGKAKEICSSIWEEEPEADNPFAAASCYCSGYDVYGDLLGTIRWAEYVFLLFRREPPSPTQAQLLELLAVAIGNPGPRDHGVRAAMNAGAGSSSSASCLIAALGVGAGQLGGARDVRLAMELGDACREELSAWESRLAGGADEHALPESWMPIEHPPGFDPHGAGCPTPVRQTLEQLAAVSPGTALPWLRDRRAALEASAGCPLAMSGVAAAAFRDLGLLPDEGEMLHLVLRLPGAAAHAIEQRRQGWRRFPLVFDSIHVTNDPGPRGPAVR